MLNLFLRAYYNKPITKWHNQNILRKIETTGRTKSVKKTKLKAWFLHQFAHRCGEVILVDGTQVTGRCRCGDRGARFKELQKVNVWIARYREVVFSRGSAVFLSLQRKST